MRLTWDPPQNPDGRHVGSMNLAVWTCVDNHAVHSWYTPPEPRHHDGCICPVARQLSTTMRTGQRLHCITLCVIMRKTDITLWSLRKQYFIVFGAGNRLFIIGRFIFSHWSLHARNHVVFFVHLYIHKLYLLGKDECFRSPYLSAILLRTTPDALWSTTPRWWYSSETFGVQNMLIFNNAWRTIMRLWLLS